MQDVGFMIFDFFVSGGCLNHGFNGFRDYTEFILADRPFYRFSDPCNP